ncbi:MAG: AAA family ATPase [Caldilineaceae bacterium SB0668_bin_21]|nr:AAA family ATPase [Caldilineaceae bacterium SB0668_bin_21]MYC20382.1 AAA family ATPase [Caldilineaceae bacterium SB0662_bin_25]
MDRQAENGTQNGQGIAGETVPIRPRAGAMELARIVDAMRAGQRPDPADVAAVKALQPSDEPGSIIDGVLKGRAPSDLIADLHSGDLETQRAAWDLVATLLPAEELRTGVEIVDSWADLEAPTRAWLIPAWLPAGRIGMVSGKGGKGKTWMLLQLAAAMATGEREWLGRASDPAKAVLPVEPGAVVFASWEDEAAEIKRRLSMWDAALRRKEGGGREAEGLPLVLRLQYNAKTGRGLRFLDMARRGPVWGVDEGDLYNQRPHLLEAGKIVREKCEEIGASLLILDSLGYAYGRNDSDNAGVADFMAAWDSWGRDHSCAVLLVHHPPKPQGDGATSSEYRGAGSWEMHARFRWELGDGAGDSDTARLSCKKASYAMQPDPVYLKRSKRTGWAWQASGEQTPPEAADRAGQRQGRMRQVRQRQKQAAGSSKGMTGAEYGGLSGKNTL